MSFFKKDNLIKKILFISKKYNLFNFNDKCLLGVSGGIDSVFLFHLFLDLKDIFKLSIYVAHVNYKLRGNDSDLDEEFVTNLCNKYSIPIFKKSIPIKSNSEIENLARNTRFDFFKNICIENNINKIVLAHNSNDLLETILMKFIRGSISSLYGMSIKRKIDDSLNIEILRPLLSISREEIKNYIERNNIFYREDYTNKSLDFTRNRIRIEIIPKIIEENKNILGTILYKSEIIKDESKYLDKLSYKYIDDCLIKKNKDHIILSNKYFNKIPEELRLRVIKNTFILLRNDYFSFDFEIIDSVNNCIIRNESNKIIKAKNNFFFIKDRDYLIFSKNYKILEDIKFEYKIIDNLILQELNLHIKIFDNKKEFVVKNYFPKENFKNKPLKDFFDKKKIPEYDRKRTFLLFYNNEIIYIYNFYNKENLNIEINPI